MPLIIVESPTKGKTISKFLGPSYKVLSSYGHVRDLPKSKLGVDTENNFNPQYVIPPKARKNLNLLKKEVKIAETIILATDEDREGEAIAWHLSEVLNLNEKKPYQRIIFHEITKSAIEEALKNPRKIDLDLVSAQQTRRILDRIVGYKLSPFLWKKILRGLSAGRVQSIAVRLIAEREEGIKNFIPQEHWEIIALLEKYSSQFESTLIKENSKNISKLGIKNQKEAQKIIKNLEKSEYKVLNIEKKETKRNPLSPFTTSTLQQESWQRFKFPAKITMRIAQGLYERGFITYHRTDSLNLSETSLLAAKIFIIQKYGSNYWPGFLRKYKAKGKVQEAHEAIRPTYPDKEPSSFKLDNIHSKLYDLIWRRFIACQMAQAIFDSTTAEIKAENSKEYVFKTTGQILKFDGFLKVYPLKFKETELPLLKKGEKLKLIKLNSLQRFTKPPSRFTEATLIKELEKNGIGRPSTYAPTLTTIQQRNYVAKNEEKKFYPTEIGIMVNDLLIRHFPEIVNIKFTAKMEENLDQIAEGKKEWTVILREFYDPFVKNLLEKEKKVSKKDLTEKTKIKCPECGKNLVIKMGRFGKFYACSGFPECKHTENLPPVSLGIRCPKCKKGELVERKTRKGKIFYGCGLFPKCNFALWNKPINKICPKCGFILIEAKKEQIKCSNKECDYERIN